jgi:hypothetical protein
MRVLTVRTVTDALLLAGERRATGPAGGFHVEAPRDGVASVRWCAPERERDSSAGLGFLEEYARLLRDAEICALVTTDGPEPRVLCSPGPVLGRRPRSRGTMRQAS